MTSGAILNTIVYYWMLLMLNCYLPSHQCGEPMEVDRRLIVCFKCLRRGNKAKSLHLLERCFTICITLRIQSHSAWPLRLMSKERWKLWRHDEWCGSYGDSSARWVVRGRCNQSMVHSTYDFSGPCCKADRPRNYLRIAANTKPLHDVMKTRIGLTKW